MPKSCVFPYQIAIQEMGHVNVIPAAEVFFRDKAGEWASSLLLIDSGASLSALPKSDAQVLGLEAEQGERIDIRGIGHKPLVGWRHELTVRLGEHELVMPLVFLEKSSARVLGRNGIFDRFTVVFEEQKHRTGLIANETSEARTIHRALDQV
jgi:hypothetical protein